MNIRAELFNLNKKQIDLVFEINKRDLGYTVSANDMSSALRGLPRPKFDKIRADSEMIINEWKAAASP